MSDTIEARELAAIERLISANENAFISNPDDGQDEDDEDVSYPGIGITFGIIRRARSALAALRHQPSVDEARREALCDAETVVRDAAAGQVLLAEKAVIASHVASFEDAARLLDDVADDIRALTPSPAGTGQDGERS